MKKSARPVTARFLLVQPEATARTRDDAEIKQILAKFLSIWAGTVDAELKQLDITVNGCRPAPSNTIKPP